MPSSHRPRLLPSPRPALLLGLFFVLLLGLLATAPVLAAGSPPADDPGALRDAVLEHRHAEAERKAAWPRNSCRSTPRRPSTRTSTTSPTTISTSR